MHGPSMELDAGRPDPRAHRVHEVGSGSGDSVREGALTRDRGPGGGDGGVCARGLTLGHLTLTTVRGRRLLAGRPSRSGAPPAALLRAERPRFLPGALAVPTLATPTPAQGRSEAAQKATWLHFSSLRKRLGSGKKRVGLGV